MRCGFRVMVASFLLLLTSLVFAASGFVVKQINVYGLKRISRAVVVRAIPIKPGQHLTPAKATATMQALYASQLFSNIRLARRDNTLVIFLKERPTIGLLLVKGNEAIEGSKIKSVLDKMKFSEGEPFDAAKLKMIQDGLTQAYAQIGYHDAKIVATVNKKSRNRVAVLLTIKEGPLAKVTQITLIGNQAFSSSTLIDQMSLQTSGWFSFLTHSDRYSAQKLQQDLQKIHDYYLDHGYLRFRILAEKASITPDKKGVSIVIRVSEGAIYHVGVYQLVGVYRDNAALKELMTIEPGSVFSRSAVMAVNKSIANYFANRGYAFPNVRVSSRLDNAKHLVFMKAAIVLGKKVYVRHINFSGNDATQESVLRLRMRQMEDSVYSLNKINLSKQKLAMLPYIQSIDVTPEMVPGHANWVDLNYKIKERSAGRAQIQAGYADVGGFVYGANVVEQNFMGTGKTAGVSFQHNDYSSSYNLSYSEPYVTMDGIGRSASLFYTHTTPSDVGLSNYDMNQFGGTLNYYLPISEFNQLTVGLSYAYTDIYNINTTLISPSIGEFIADKAGPYNQISVNLGWSRTTFDRSIFPRSGSQQSLGVVVGVPVIKSSLGYYKATLGMKWYWPLGAGFIVNPHSTFGFGDGFGSTPALPFYNNFYAGGIATLPGFSPYSLGPRNPINISQNLGGNLELLAGVNLIFPNFISHNLRTSLFVDAGNIFDTRQLAASQVSYESLSWQNIRASAGLMISWYVPFLGPIDFSVSYPFLKRPGDTTSPIGFTFGAVL